MNPVTNKIYVANNASNNVTVIDGATNSTTTVSAGSAPVSVAVNPVTNKIYVANCGQQQRDGDRRGHQLHHHRERRNQPQFGRREPGHEQDLRGQRLAATT